jgi:hypothetical protein
VVDRAPALLAPRRLAAFALLGAAVGAYYVWRRSLPDLTLWWDVAVLALVIIPAVLALLYVPLPLWRLNGWFLLGAAAALALIAWGCYEQRWYLAANFAKLFAPAFLGWWFLAYFESLSWVVLVACLIPFVDIYSVFWGPTNTITEQHFEVYSSLAFSFVVPDHSSAKVGPPDLLFFALFVAAADRFGLRTRLTFALCTLSFGATVAIAQATGVDGLPALPLLSLGFLAANGDLLWRSLRRAPTPRAPEEA